MTKCAPRARLVGAGVYAVACAWPPSLKGLLSLLRKVGVMSSCWSRRTLTQQLARGLAQMVSAATQASPRHHPSHPRPPMAGAAYPHFA